MTHKQVVMAALILGLVAAGVVWWLERYNRELLINQSLKDRGTELDTADMPPMLRMLLAGMIE